MADWYETNIEPEIRPIVRLLRDNGVNTECSCGHEMYVQCQYNHDGFLWAVDKLLFNAGYRDYVLSVQITREDGHLRHHMDIHFRKTTGGD
jgi:hypothetical protein